MLIRAPKHGPVHLLLQSAAKLGSFLDWDRPGLPVISLLAGPVQHFRSAVLDGRRNFVSAELCGKKGFREGPYLDWLAPMQLLPILILRM